MKTWSAQTKNGVIGLLVIGLTGAATFGAATPAHAIAYGENVPQGQYSFSVRLVMTGIPTTDQNSRDSSCSGALIAARWVITAGHCFRDADGTRVSQPVAKVTTAVIGRTDLNGHSGHEARVIEVRQSPTTDVALAQLDTAITDIKPLQLTSAAPAPGTTVRLTGYGFTRGGETDLATRLQTGQFAVTAVDDVTVSMSGRRPRNNTSPCPHDSGGPYFTTRADGTAELVAVVSNGPSCPHSSPDLGARIDIIHEWISANIDGMPSAGSISLLSPWATFAAFLAAILGVGVVAFATLSNRRKGAHV